MSSLVGQPGGSRGHTVMDTFKDQVPTAISNSFIAGLKTEYTGLNFPPNAATDTSNCIYTMIGDVTRRLGFDYELNYTTTAIDRTNKAITSYRWLNVGGDGETQVYVLQVGSTLYFYKSSTATVADPLSTQILSSTINISNFLASGSSLDPSTIECQFADGNGYMFVYHPYCDPICCTYDSSVQTISASAIIVEVRDFNGFPEPASPTTFRPTTLTNEHLYNLQNQGWTDAVSWTTSASTSPSNWTSTYSPASLYLNNGTITFSVSSGLSITNGTPVNINYFAGFIIFAGGSNQQGESSGTATGVVVSYSGTTLVVQVSNTTSSAQSGEYQYPDLYEISISASNQISTISTWYSAAGNYPSNADVWWNFKDSSGVFDPSTTIANIGLPTSPAPTGHFILNAFNQQTSNISGISSLTPIVTSKRPRTGAWFQGRVWYTGVDDSQTRIADQNYYTWTENLYFSQIITQTSDFGACYQTNDPTDENLFNLLPSDGGVITIQGCGAIYKLFPIQNGMLVFAANGIWFITGSQGIGFTANDYTITKISAVESISSTSFVDVQGLPVFWNEEGVYTVSPAQQGLGLQVNPITLGTILSFYSNIPLDSKKFVKGAYNPITYILQWTYRSTEETDITSRYEYDSVLCLNVRTQAFYPYSLAGTPYIHGVVYVANPGGSSAPSSIFKYVTSTYTGSTYNFTFSEERNTDYLDWYSYDSVGVNFSSYFVTGYSLEGQGQRKFQPGYVYMYSRLIGTPVAYSIQGIWDFSTSGDSGKYSSKQLITIYKPYFGMAHRRHRIRGHGYCLQLKVSSVDNLPFDFMGWSIWSTQNESV
jgi:hypothetical protein